MASGYTFKHYNKISIKPELICASEVSAKFYWTVYDYSDSKESIFESLEPILEIPEFFLAPETYKVVLKISSVSNVILNTQLHILASELEAVIIGGNGTASTQQQILLDASQSYDPDQLPGEM